MGTIFEQVFERAIFKFSDFAHISFSESIRSEILFQHLISAIVDFQNSSRFPLTYRRIIEVETLNDTVVDDDCDENLEEDEEVEPIEKYAFDVELGEEEIQILATGIVFHWLSSQVLKSEHMKNILHNKDFNSYSPANLLKELRELRAAIRRDFRGLITSYSFRHSNLDRLCIRRRNFNA